MAGRQNKVWLFEHKNSDGNWILSIDYTFPWRTKSAAERKLKELGGYGNMYRIVCYERRAKKVRPNGG